MKVRWTEESLRLRITPDELQQLLQGRRVGTRLAFPGGGCWRVEVDPACTRLGVAWREGAVAVQMAPGDVARLAEPDREGVYGAADGRGEPRVLIEKDFPCAHPHSDEACEPETPRFAPTATFLERRGLTSTAC